MKDPRISEHRYADPLISLHAFLFNATNDNLYFTQVVPSLM